MHTLRPHRALAHPLWWGALVVLVLNDHLFKALWGGAITGKLSDVVGLAVAAPLVAVALRARHERQVAVSFAITGLAFAALQHPAGASLAETVTKGLGVPWRVWPDPWDLLALPSLFVAWFVLRPAMEGALPARRRLERLALAVGALACCASSYRQPEAPRVHEGRAYAGSYGPIYGIDVASGARASETQLEGGYLWGRVVHEGTIYGYDGPDLLGVRILDGAEVLRTQSRGGPFYGALHHTGGLLIGLVGPGGDYDQEHVVAYTPGGELRWETPLESERAWRSPPESPRLGSGLVVVPTERAVVALDPFTGQQAWSRPQPERVIEATPAGRYVAAVREDDRLLVFEAETGKTVWERTVPGASQAPGGSWWRLPRLAATEDALILREDGHLVAFDPATSEQRWRSADEVAAATIGQRQALVWLADERIGLVDLTTGATRWARDVEAPVTEPVLSETSGVALIMPDHDELVALELADGSPRWTFDLDDGVQVFDVAEGRVWIRRVAAR